MFFLSLFYIMILIIILSIILFLLLILNLVRYHLYQKMVQLKKRGISSQEENLLYDDYYHNSNHKKNNKLVCQIGVFRKFFFSAHLDYEIEMLHLRKQDKDRILIVSNFDSSLELEAKILELYPNLEIMTFTSNLMLAKNLRLQVTELGLENITIGYGNPEDIYSQLEGTEYKFDRILVRECLGNIQDRNKFFENLSRLLSPSGFIILRTFTFKPIFQGNEDITASQNREYHRILKNQKKLIDYWNYNFSTTQSIINDITEHFSHCEYEELDMLKLIYLYNFQDFRKAMRIYLLDIGHSISNLSEWQGISSLQVLVIRVS